MITTTETKVIIEIEHPCPDEVIKDIRVAMISSLQNRKYDKHTDLKEIQQSNFFMLELLKHTL